MPHITLRPNSTPAPETPDAPRSVKHDLGHPVRMRIMGILLDDRPRTQRELGRILLMSSAAVHYHLAALVKLGVVRLHSTHPGPNGIVEKLYSADRGRWQEMLTQLDAGVDVRFYLDYTAAWAHERHREGLEILKAGEHEHPFLLGSYVVQAPTAEVVKLKREIWKKLEAFHKRYADAAQERAATCSVTFSILPSLAGESKDSLNALEYDPEESGKETPCKRTRKTRRPT